MSDFLNTKVLNKLFNLLVIYYWSMIYLQSIQSIEGTLLLYLTFLLPISLFALYSLFFIKRKTVPNEILWIVLFIFSSAILSIARFDVTSLMAGTLFGVIIIIISYFKLAINLKLINYLFLISVIISPLLYYSGFSIYGFIPGQSSFSNLEALAGRVSLFPNVSISIYFSFMVFLLNAFFNKSKSKLFFMLLSFYFIYFGVSRTILIAFIIILFLYIISKIYKMDSKMYKIISIFLIGIPFLLIINIEHIIGFLLNSNNNFIMNYVFRGYNDFDEIMIDMARVNIWSEHTRLFFIHPFGLSVNDMERYIDRDLIGGAGNESFFTRMLVQYGISAIFIFIYLFSLLKKSIIQKDLYTYVYVYLFLFIGFIYGSFFSVYNVLFLIFISSININYQNKKIY